ncbi:MAG: LamB/YcsF family protein [Gaiellaceae bacterium]
MDGAEIPLEAASICIHGDGPNAADVAASVRAAVESAGWSIETRA